MQQPKILVAIRKRPLSKKQQAKGQTDTVSIKNSQTIVVSEYKQKVDLTKYLEETIFNFDYAFHQEVCNQQIYETAVRPLVDSAFLGAKVTCFAYGQTGSGKTFTMNGNISQGVPGLYTLGSNDIFDYLTLPDFKHLKARLSFYQIYCGKLYDLLNKRNELKLREDNKNNINIIGLQEAPVSSSQQFHDYMIQGGKERVTSMNSANADSSRSHAILQISLKDGKKLHGKISFIDLAGNQRGADHMDMGKQTRIDGAQINKSLLSLKQCIRALDQGKGHTPFRGSKLTMVLKDSFIGFCRTVMIGNVSPSSASSQNTLNTLRYADRVKQMRRPQQSVNKEEMRAKELMLPRQNKNAIKIMLNNDDDAEDIAIKREAAQKEYGLVEDPLQKKMREDNTGRKNSFNGKIQPKQQTKSSSVNKNPIGNSLNHRSPNNNINPAPALLNNKGQYMNNNQNIRKPMDIEGPGVPQGLHRYNSSQYGTVGRKEQPMDIQHHDGYYLPNNNKDNYQNNQNNKFFGNQARGYPQQQPNINHSQNIQNNYSNNLGMSPNFSMSQHPYPHNQPNQQSQSNNQGQYYCQSGYGQRQIYPPQQNNFMSNSEHYPQRNGQQPPPPPEPQHEYQIPENWEEMANTVANSKDPVLNQKILTQMNQCLFSEQQVLIQNHSDSLRRQIDIIKGEMKQLNDMEKDRGKITSRGYVHFMQQSIEEKISQLQQLRQKMISFTYKLDTLEQVERKGPREGDIDDEQLLDDINIKY